MTKYPHRVRLHGGQHIHAARTVPGDEGAYRLTACGNSLAPDAVNTWLPAATTVTCRTCIRKLPAA